MLFVVMLGSLLGAATDEIAPGLELTYSGKLTPADEKSPAKSFTYHAAVLAVDKDRTDIAWSLEERGGNGWQWPERFGEFGVLAKTQKPTARSPALLQEFDDSDYVVPLPAPIFEYRDRLQENAEFQEGQIEYVVTGDGKVQDRDCWRVEATLPRGRRQTLAVEKSSGLIVSVDERLFLGRGVPFELKLELQSAKSHAAAEVADWNDAWSRLLALQAAVARSPDRPRADFTSLQVAAAQKAAESLPESLAGSPWEKLAAVILRDLKQQSRRLTGVAGLEKKFVGKEFPAITLRTFDDEKVDSTDWKGQVVVLHFWEYPGDKLVEPYGQVGYLDFLNDKRKKLGVKVVGIAVDERVTDPARKTAAKRPIKKLQQFMNLSYDVLLDDGSALAEVGDPRKVDAQLPLWIVVDADGTILHYKSGLYEIKPDEGLKQLDEAVLDAIKKRPR